MHRRSLVVSRTRTALFASAIVCANFFSACSPSSDSINGIIASQVPTSLDASVSTTIPGVAGAIASSSPAVALHDAAGVGIANVYVHFAVTGGGKVANDSALTDANGVASAGTWTLGTTVGSQTVTATVSGLAAVTFTAQVAAAAATRAIRVSTDSTKAIVNTVLVAAPSVQVLDQYGNPVAGVTVSFSVTSGNGTVTGAQKTTGATGVATLDSWQLGTAVGVQQVRADVTGLSSITFTATATVGAPAVITALGGNGGSGVVNASLASYASLPSVTVTDAFGNPVSGVPVTFTPSTNSGTVSGGVAVTNDAGTATVSDWILGTATTQTLIATSTAIPGGQAVFTVSAIVSTFDITVRYVDGAPSARQQLAVSRAVEKWKSVINGSSGTSKVVLAAGGCGRSWMPAINETVTNVLILAKIGTIDGVGKVLGNANSCVLHSGGSQLTVLGTMYFDSEDLATLEGNGLIDVVILHEMGHVLGIGSLWGAKGVISGAGGNDPIFTGTTGLAQFSLIGGTTYSGRPVPVENLGGSGTADVHWRESVFHNELMTGYVNSGSNPMSRVSVGSLADLGYSVNYAGVDAFSIGASLLASPFETPLHLQNDIVETEVFTTDMQGRRGVPRVRPN